nr:chaplin [Streptomyces sp. HNM0574]
MKRAVAVTAIAGGIVAGGAGAAFAESAANGAAQNSPGVGSGNLVQAPVHIPANVTGNNVSVIGVLNPVFGNASANG